MTDTLAKEARGNLIFSREDGALSAVTKYRKTPGGNLFLEGVAVFRSGTFRDSMGFQHVWETEHMTQMVDNHAALSGRGVLEHIPVRKDHVGFLDSSLSSVIGYNTNIRTEERMNTVSGEMCTYLLADMEIIDEDAIRKIESGLWRNLSSEIGTYLTNAEAEYWPVYMGVAFVDFPAVEGLANSFSKRGPNDSGIHAGSAVFSLVNEQEDPDMATKKATATLDEKVEEGAVKTQDIADGAVDLSTHSNDASGEVDDADDTEVSDGEENASGDSTEPNEDGSDENDADDSTDGGNDEAGDEKGGEAEFGLAGQSFQFSVNGQPTTDFAAVQAHITTLEATIEHGREQQVEGFVQALADEGKILATQIDSLTGFAKSLDEGQYSAWAGQYGDMPKLPLFGHHGAGSNRIENPEDLKESEAIQNELKIQKEIQESYSKSTNGKTLKSVEDKIKNLEGELAAVDGKN